MNCLHCGDCCLRMCPIADDCPHLIEDDTFYFCGDYENRPEQCKNHKFDSRHCPIGMDKLKIGSIEQLQQRLENGYNKIKNLNPA